MDDNTTNEYKLYRAARDNTVDVLCDVLERTNVSERSTALEKKTKDGDQFTTPLIISARNGNLDSVKKLLSYKADIEARGTLKVSDEVIEGCTPLWAAAATGHLDVVTYLIERNAEIDGRTARKSTPLRAAAYIGRLDIVTYLVENGADVNAATEFESTPLMITCYNGHLNVATYLIAHGANINLQDRKGDTALHYATEGDYLTIVDKLLTLGAAQVRNFKRLTPLLTASNKCKVELVEYFINRSECTKEQRIDALELLGATMAITQTHISVIEKAFCYMKRGMGERFEDTSYPLLKEQKETLEVYQNRKESGTLDELALLEDDYHAIRMEGLLIRERILGNDNTELCYPIRYCGAVCADSGNFDLCIVLWRHAMDIAQRCNQPITYDLESFAEVFADMLTKNVPLGPTFIKEVFDNLRLEYEKWKDQGLQSRKLHKGTKEDELEKLLYCALNLLMIYTKVQEPENQNKPDILHSLKKYLRLNPRSNEGNTLLHLAACCRTPINGDFVRRVCKTPCIETIKLVLKAGCYANYVNNNGETALHLAVTYKPSVRSLQLLRDVLEILLDGGVHEDLVNNSRKTAIDIAKTDEARRILSARRRLELKCIAARAVREFGLSYVGVVPKTVEKFISLH